MFKTLTAALAAAGIVIAGGAATASAAPAPPVKVVSASPLILHPYYIQSADFGTYIIGLPAERQFLEPTATISYEQTSSAPYSYNGHLWYQWADTDNTAYCLATSSDGPAHVNLAPCNGTDEKQFFYNNALTGSEFLNLESTVYEGTNYGCWSENSSAFAVNAWTSSIAYKWNFVSA